MPKFYGAIGFSTDQNEVSPGLFTNVIEERYYYGDILRVGYQNGTGNDSNEEVTITNDFSILGDEYILSRVNIIKYIIFHGIKWTVKSVKIDGRRVILSLGGVYNDQEPSGSTYSFGEC